LLCEITDKAHCSIDFKAAGYGGGEEAERGLWIGLGFPVQQARRSAEEQARRVSK